MVEPRHLRLASQNDRINEARQKLSGGGGDGTSGDMDVRIAKLESSMAHAERDISELRSDMKTVLGDVATLKENVRHLPTKPWMFTSLGALLLAIGGLVGLIVRFVPHA